MIRTWWTYAGFVWPEMVRLTRRTRILWAVPAALVALGVLTAQTAAAPVGDGTPASCTAAALAAAVQAGGDISFDCGPAPITIVLTGTLDVVAAAAIDGGGLVTLSGDNTHRVFAVATGGHLSLTRLTIAGGSSATNGGGILNNGSLTVSESTFHANSAGTFGGAIDNYGHLELRDTIFRGNNAGINGGAIDTTVGMTVTGALFEANSAGVRGGAVNNYLGRTLIATSVFTGNQSGGYGGALVNDGGAATVLGSTFTANSAQGEGGGIRNSGDLAVWDTTLAGNHAYQGGALANSGGLLLSNSTLHANTADQGSGGVEASGAQASTRIEYSTLVGNQSFTAIGGNLYAAGAGIIGSIVVQGSPFDCSGAVASQGYNVEGAASCGFTQPGDAQNQVVGLSAFGDNGGPAATFVPLSANLVDKAPLVLCLPADGRGLPRPQGGACDIGAVEALGATAPPAGPPNTPPWPMAQRAGQRDSRAALPGPDDAVLLGAPWPFTAAGQVTTAPAVDFVGTAYFGAADGVFYAVDQLGRQKFALPAGSPILGSPALVPVGPGPTPGEFNSGAPLSATVYFGADDATLHAVTTEGVQTWSLRLGSDPLRSPVLAVKSAGGLNRVFAGSEGGRLYAVFETSTTAATVAWSAEAGAAAGAALATAPAISADGQIVYVGGGDGRLYCFEAGTGALLPGTPVPVAAGKLAAPLVDTLGSVYAGTADGLVLSFDKQCRLRPYWRARLALGPVIGMAQGPAGEVIALTPDAVYGLSLFGRMQWSAALPRAALQPPIADAAGTVYVAAQEGWLYAITHRTGATSGAARWALRVDASGANYLGAAAIDGLGRIVLGAGSTHLAVVDDLPAFQILYHGEQAAPGNRDIYSLRESYGVVDAARTLRLTEDAGADEQPAYSLDRGATALASNRLGGFDSFVAGGVVELPAVVTAPAAGSPFTASTAERDAAFSAVNDLTYVGRTGDRLPYLAVTSKDGVGDRLFFVDLFAQRGSNPRVLTFSDWALAQGTPNAIVQQLEPPDTQQSQAAFSPDGKRLAWRHCDFNGQRASVWLLELAGAASKLVQAGAGVPIEGNAACEDFAPAFAPDSNWLAQQENGRLAVYAVASPATPIFAGAGPAGHAPLHPAWSPDGSEIAVAAGPAGARSLYALSGSQYGGSQVLAGPGATDEPFYHFFKLPPPQAKSISPDRQHPGEVVQIMGRGFDVLHPLDNRVFFTDSLHLQWVEAEVIGAAVVPDAGLAALSVRVPDMAGSGAIKVVTRVGETSCCQFFVLPRPLAVVQARSTPGARVRVFGLGFDLVPPAQHEVLFAKAGGGQVASPVLDGGLAGGQEYLIVQVPEGIAENGPITVRSAQGSGPCACTLTLLHPRLTFIRPDVMSQYAKQGCANVNVQVALADFPRDEFFGLGESINLVAAHPSQEIPLTTYALAASGPDTAQLVTQTLTFPDLSAFQHPGGELVMVAQDKQLAAVRVLEPFRIPLTNIPIIFVPGTSGTSLDLAPGTATPFTHQQPADVHYFPWICKTCLPGELGGPIVHPPWSFPIFGSDPRGPRVWIGAEGVGAMLNPPHILRGNIGDHFLDAVAYTSVGIPLHPEIVPGTVMSDTITNALCLLSNPPDKSVCTESVYTQLYGLILNPPASGGLGRPLCSRLGSSFTCRDAGGRLTGGQNGFYPFNLDWRESNPVEAARLNTFVNNVLAFSGAPKVLIITHSYGGPVARTYQLTAGFNADAKVDQIVSFGGGFLGVIEGIKILEMGGTWGSGYGYGSLTVGVAAWATQALAQNWPTAYFQMPHTRAWFSDHGLLLNGERINRSYIRDHRLPTSAGEVVSQEGSTAWLANRHNVLLANNQAAFFMPPGAPAFEQGDFYGGSGSVYFHRVISKGRMDTSVGVKTVLGPSLACLEPLKYLLPIPNTPLNPLKVAAECLVPTEWRYAVQGDGDSTVSYHGALGLTSPYDDRVYILDKVVHSSMTEVGSSLLLLRGIIGGSVCSERNSTGFASQGEVQEILGSALSPLAREMAAAGAEGAAPQPDRWLVEARGVVRLTAVDSAGRRTGTAPANGASLVAREIPDATYFESESGATLFLAHGDVFTITLTSPTPGLAQLYLRQYNSVGRFETFYYADVTFDPAGNAALVFDAAQYGAAPSLRTDVKGDGRVTEQAPIVLTPEQGADAAAPVTRITMDGRLVTLTASDEAGGAGVRRIYYQVDGSSPQVYGQPFHTPPGTKIVRAWSVDRAGNLESPGVTHEMAAGGGWLYLPAIRRP